MKIYIYKGGLSLVAKSGVGSAIRHQEKMLRAAKVTVTDVWKEADIVQINTVLPDSPLVARRARRQGKKVVYYGHSTMEDFKNSFIGSNLAAPLFKKWIRHCYRQGDVVITPTEYSRELLMKYDLHREIYALTNGVDTEFFHKTEQAGGRFRIFFHLPVDKKGRDIRRASDSQKRNRGFSGNGKKDARHYFSMVWGREQCIDSGRDQKGCGREAGKCDLCRFPTVRDPAGCVLWCGCICFFQL